MKTVATNRKLRELITGIDSGSLIPRPDFQRRLVWTNKEKVAFIETVLNRYPFPEIYVAAGEVDEDTGLATEYLVDGQQRITTLYQYFKGMDSIKLPRRMSKYAELISEDKREFLQYDVVVRDLGDLDIATIKKIFQQINLTSYSLNAMEIDNSRFAGEFKMFGEEIAQMEFFESRGFFTANDVRRMQDLRYCLILVSTMMSSYFNQSSKIENFLETYNDSFPDSKEIKERVVQLMEFVEACDFDPKSRVWNKADLFTLFIEMDKTYYSKDVEPDTNTLSAALKEFYSSVEDRENADALLPDIEKYFNAAIQGSNSRSRRIERGEILRTIIAPKTMS